MNMNRRCSHYVFSREGLYLDSKKYVKNFLRYFKHLITRSLAKRDLEVKFISNDFGFSRGTPIDRHYIHNFFCENASFVTGCCLEFGDSTYMDKYGIDVTKKVTFNYSDAPFSSGRSIAGDIAKPNSLPSEEFDCIVCVNVLNFIYDLSAATLGLRRMLKQNGKLLLTLAGVSSHVSRYDMNRWGDYWRLTDKAAIKLLEDSGFTIEAMRVYGNPYACTAQLNGFSTEDVVQSELFPSHPDYQLVLAFTLSKS